MKNLIISFVLLFAVNTFAATLKVSSFQWVRLNSTQDYNLLAELCGKVIGQESAPSHINIKVDYDGNNPGSYNTISDEDGNFCATVVTYRGSAKLSLIGEDAQGTTTKIKK